jgi:leucyl-tRNA synthetase
MFYYKKFDFKRIRSHTQELRHNMTDSEKILWEELRSRKLSGFKFLRQHPILYRGNLKRYNYFVTDFYCAQKKILIELDGPIHDTSEEYDRFRESELKGIGFHILRIRNEELVNMKKVLQNICLFIQYLTSPPSLL